MQKEENKFLQFNLNSINFLDFFFFFFFFRHFPSFRSSHNVLSFSKPSCFQRPFPSHQPPPYPPSPHPKVFSLVSLFSSPATPIIFLLTYSWSLLITCPYHLSLPSLIFIPNRSTLTVPLIYSFLILSFFVTPMANLNIFISRDFHLFHLFLCDCHRLKSIHHCWSHH